MKLGEGVDGGATASGWGGFRFEGGFSTVLGDVGRVVSGVFGRVLVGVVGVVWS